MWGPPHSSYSSAKLLVPNRQLTIPIISMALNKHSLRVGETNEMMREAILLALEANLQEFDKA